MPYAKIEKSGCEVWHGGLIKLRADLFLTPEDKRYDERYILVPIIPPEGYPGEKDKEGRPEDQADYDAWLEHLPHIYQLNPFHSHFLRFEPTVSQDAVEAAINHHIPNFYKAWTEELDKVPGGMRHGWDIATRPKAIGRPRRYDLEMNPTELQARKLECLSKLDLIIKANFSIQSSGEGETFPSTEIDVGSAAIGRDSQKSVSDGNGHFYTQIDYNNAANATGSMDTVESWFHAAGAGNSFKVGTFTDNGSDSLTCHDAWLIGEVSAGSKQTATGGDMDITSGEFLGGDGRTDVILQLENVESGGAGGRYSVLEQNCDPTDEDTYSYDAGHILSLYGTGETAETNIEVTAPLADTVNLAGYAPTLSIGINLLPPIATADGAGYAPTFVISINLSAPLADTVNLLGYAPEVGVVAIIEAPLADTINLQGYAPTFVIDNNLLPPIADTIGITGLAPTLSVGINIAAALAETIALLGFAPNLSIGVNLSPPVADTVNLAGYAPTISIAISISAPLADTVDIQGYAPTIAISLNINAPVADTVALLGYAARIIYKWLILNVPEAIIADTLKTRTFTLNVPEMLVDDAVKTRDFTLEVPEMKVADTLRSDRLE